MLRMPGPRAPGAPPPPPEPNLSLDKNRCANQPLRPPRMVTVSCHVCAG